VEGRPEGGCKLLNGDNNQQALAREYGTPTSKQMEMINELAMVELQPEQVFVFPDKLVGDMIIPNRYMRISKQLLNVFKEDANSGVSLLIDHPWAGFGRPKAAIPYGRTFNSKLKKSDVEGEEWALFADHYIVRGKEIDGISTDSIIASIEDGTFFDTSIGWGADKYECSVCGKSYFSCEHYAGREYEGEICHVIAKPPGFLMENSIVMDGAYPGAGVLSKNGNTENADMVLVDDMKGLSPGVSLFHTFSARKGKLLTFARREDIEKKIIAQGATLSKGGEIVDKDKLDKDFEKEVKDELEKESKEEAKEVERAEANIDIFLTRNEVEDVFGNDSNIGPEGLLMYAKEGMEYLSELAKEAEKWGVRAQGDKYNKEAWQTRYELMSADELKDIIETFKVEAESAILTGRQSDPDADKAVKPAGGYPDEAFEM